MTNVSEKTIPVRAIIPDAIPEQTDMAEAGLMVDTRLGKYACSSRGKTNPAATVTTVYAVGTNQREAISFRRRVGLMEAGRAERLSSERNGQTDEQDTEGDHRQTEHFWRTANRPAISDAGDE